MLNFTVDSQSFGLGFIFGTAVYVVASGAAYIVFSAGRRAMVLLKG
jgi:hypothetical protein